MAEQPELTPREPAAACSALRRLSSSLSWKWWFRTFRNGHRYV